MSLFDVPGSIPGSLCHPERTPRANSLSEQTKWTTGLSPLKASVGRPLAPDSPGYAWAEVWKETGAKRDLKISEVHGIF